MAHAALSVTPAEGDGSISDPPTAAQTGAAGHAHERLHGSG